MEGFAELAEAFRDSGLNAQLFCAIAAGIAVFIFEIKFTRAYPMKNRRLEKAVRLGHVVTGTRIKSGNDYVYGKSLAEVIYYATYTYEVDGREYRYRYAGVSIPPKQITFYYIRSPRRVFSDFDKRMNILEPVVVYGLPVATMILVAKLLGYTF